MGGSFKANKRKRIWKVKIYSNELISEQKEWERVKKKSVSKKTNKESQGRNWDSRRKKKTTHTRTHNYTENKQSNFLATRTLPHPLKCINFLNRLDRRLINILRNINWMFIRSVYTSFSFRNYFICHVYTMTRKSISYSCQF